MTEDISYKESSQSLTDVIKKIRNTDFPYKVNEKWEKECQKDQKSTKLTFINQHFTKEEQKVLLNASAQNLYDILINT